MRKEADSGVGECRGDRIVVFIFACLLSKFLKSTSSSFSGPRCRLRFVSLIMVVVDGGGGGTGCGGTTTAAGGGALIVLSSLSTDDDSVSLIGCTGSVPVMVVVAAVTVAEMLVVTDG